MTKLFAAAPLLAAVAHGLSSPMADPSAARSIAPVTDFKGGAGVGRLVLDDGTSLDAVRCKYDMVLVERLQPKAAKTESGLFVLRENLPKLHLYVPRRVVIVSASLLGRGLRASRGALRPL